MGTLIYNSGLPEELRTNHFADINGQWIEKINDPRCAAVIGAFAYLTYERLLTVLSRRKMAIILSGSDKNHFVIKASYPDAVNSYSGQKYTGITKLDLKGLSSFNKLRLERITNFGENTPFRFLLNQSIKKPSKEWGQPTLHAKSFGLVDKDGIIYEWITGGHNPTINGNDSLDSYSCIKREKDPDEIEKHIDTWIDWLYESVVLDINKSPDLVNALQFEGRNKDTLMLQAWSKAHLTYSKYADEEVNFDDYFIANEYCADLHHYLVPMKNRRFISQVSLNNNIPIGVDDKYLKQFQQETKISLSLREFFPISEQKTKKSLILHMEYRKKMLFHNSLKEHLLSWLDKCPRSKTLSIKTIDYESKLKELETYESKLKELEAYESKLEAKFKELRDYEAKLTEVEQQTERKLTKNEQLFNQKFANKESTNSGFQNGRKKDLILLDMEYQ
ncbi:MAG: hypothetical protein ACO36B_06585 [Methylophilaceae bacterium]